MNIIISEDGNGKIEVGLYLGENDREEWLKKLKDEEVYRFGGKLIDCIDLGSGHPFTDLLASLCIYSGSTENARGLRNDLNFFLTFVFGLGKNHGENNQGCKS